MHIKLFSSLPSLNDYEVKFPRWHFMSLKFFKCKCASSVFCFEKICLFPKFDKSKRKGVEQIGKSF